MLRRLTMIAIGLGIMGFCMGMMPQKVEAGQVTHRIIHHGWPYEQGSTMNAAGGGVKYFSLDSWGIKADVYMGNLPSGGPYYAWAKMWRCGKGKSQWVTIRPWSQTFTFGIYSGFLS